VVDLEASQRVYDERPFGGFEHISRISGLSRFFPDYLGLRDLRAYTRAAKWELVGREVVNGFACD
jgi:hypothetical protein